MLKGSILVVLLILLIATPVVAGDPLDGNDGPAISRTTMNVEEECGRAEKLVHCGWCWNRCMFAIMADLWTGGGGWDGDDW